ncbi:hypothetical protein GCM10023149_37790 [Mucilaginibacter gynuensis]|uniref:Uncharacterized protein n=1 Tax=Mucilaginibacter gynuensis TaxID=1302236 RepID=A0ABP8GYF6_9SPHI
MKFGIIIINSICFLTGLMSHAQQAVFDGRHYQSVTANGVARSTAEATHEYFLSNIVTNIDNLNKNVGAVVLAQTMIYQALSNVNSLLKNGLEVRYMAELVGSLIAYTNKALILVKNDPQLLIFARDISGVMRARAMILVRDVSEFVLRGGQNILADYSARDQLLRAVTQELQILNGLAYGAWKAMFWAKECGTIASLNPFAGYVNHDRLIVNQIIHHAKYLKP